MEKMALERYNNIKKKKPHQHRLHPMERGMALSHFNASDTKGPHVGLLVVSLFQNDFRGNPVGSPDESVPLQGGVGDLTSNSKIHCKKSDERGGEGRGGEE